MGKQTLDDVRNHLRNHACHHAACHKAVTDHEHHQVPEPAKERQQTRASAPHSPSAATQTQRAHKP